MGGAGVPQGAHSSVIVGGDSRAAEGMLRACLHAVQLALYLVLDVCGISRLWLGVLASVAGDLSLYSSTDRRADGQIDPSTCECCVWMRVYSHLVS